MLLLNYKLSHGIGIINILKLTSRNHTLHLANRTSDILLPFHPKRSSYYTISNSSSIFIECGRTKNRFGLYDQASTSFSKKLLKPSSTIFETNMKRYLSTSTKAKEEKKIENDKNVLVDKSETIIDDDDGKGKGKQSRASMLKQAVRDYGGTVIVFHITISLTSLGFFYLLVSSGLDVGAILEWLGLDGKIFESKLTQEGSKFVIAYAVHKIFAPARIGITLTATPFIVRKLRAIGILKKPLP